MTALLAIAIAVGASFSGGRGRLGAARIGGTIAAVIDVSIDNEDDGETVIVDARVRNSPFGHEVIAESFSRNEALAGVTIDWCRAA